MNNMNNQKAINWINAVKALSVLAVFFVHSELIYGKLLPIDRYIYPWYVNAFFFISGYLLFWKQLSVSKIDESRKTYILTGGGKSLIFNVLYRIVIPSIIFSIIEFAPSCLFQGRDISISFFLFKTLGGGTYWFTSALVVAELVLFLLFCTRKRNIWFYVASCLCIGASCLLFTRMGVFRGGFWAWRRGLMSLIFIAIGGLYWCYEKQIDKFMKWWFALVLLAVYILIIYFYKQYSDPLISTLTIQPLGFVTSIISCLLLVWLCKCLKEYKPLTFIGQNSLGFYFLSGAVPVTLNLIVSKTLTEKYYWMMLIIFVVSIIIAYIAVNIINRWLPWLWDLRTIKKNTSK